jgi:nicotinate-nucleotide adenylyltransferase
MPAGRRSPVIPAGDHPHKRSTTWRRPATAWRCAGCFRRHAGRGRRRPRIAPAGPSFTVDTLAELAAEYPGRRLFFLIGSDNLPLLPTWHNHHAILQLATVVTYPRRGYPIDPALLAGLDLTPAERSQLLSQVLDLPADDTAASTLRERWRRGERDLPELPAAVVRYLLEHPIYRS